MKNKTYRYFVSFMTSDNECGNATLVYDEPMDTEQMLTRPKRDICKLAECKTAMIIFYKRIKDNR